MKKSALIDFWIDLPPSGGCRWEIRDDIEAIIYEFYQQAIVTDADKIVLLNAELRK